MSADRAKTNYPICGEPISQNPRYPNAVCGRCAGLATDETGRRLGFANENPSGGFVAYYLDTDETHDSHMCFVNGIRCWADEARFGEIVIQVDNAAEREKTRDAEQAAWTATNQPRGRG